MDFSGKKITVMGLGLHGGGAGLVRFLVKSGAEVLVTDLKKEKELAPTLKKLSDLKVNYHLGGHSWRDFASASLVFVNPAVPKDSLYLKKIEKEKIPTSSEMNLFFNLCPASIIGITGTNGKSTTATLIYEILKKLKDGKKIFLGGNIGGSLLLNLDEMTENDLVILELSSFQLQDLARDKNSPHISVVLNITPDHLDRHKDFFEYTEIKKNIVRFQTESDFAVLNFSDTIVKKFDQVTKARVLFFSLEPKKGSVFLDENQIINNWRGANQKIITTRRIKIPGRHNIENILAACSVGAIYKVRCEKMAQAISSFRGLAHRIELVGEEEGVRFYNDSKATTPESTIAALESFSEPIILIAGGSDKGADFKKMSEKIIEKVRILILLGETAKTIKKMVIEKKNKRKKQKILLEKILKTRSLSEAVSLAKKQVKSSEVVLLSPACASFDMFSNFEERGEKFKELVNKSVSQEVPPEARLARLDERERGGAKGGKK